MRIGHTTVRRNKRVIVFMRYEDNFIDTFLKNEGKSIFLKDHGEIRKDKIRGLAIYKGGDINGQTNSK